MCTQRNKSRKNNCRERKLIMSMCDFMCQETCELSCMSSCQKNCQCSAQGCQTCQSTCQVNCTSYCQNYCQSSCQLGCQSSCEQACQCSAQGCQTCQTTCQFQCQDTCETSCQSSCQTGCQSSCELACQCSAEGCQTCQTTCQFQCQDRCETTCQSSCQRSCQSTCESSCQSTCEVNCTSFCQNYCQSTCQTSCQNCEGACMSGCEVNCENCEGACMSGCEVSCENCEGACMSVCEVNCENCEGACLNCEGACMSGCEVICENCEGACLNCQGACLSACEVGCENSCEIGCEAACEAGCESVCEANCENTQSIPFNNYFQYTPSKYNIMVENAQEFLKAWHEDQGISLPTGFTVDGLCGGNTETSISTYQSNSGYIQDGKLSKLIYDELFSYWLNNRFLSRNVIDHSKELNYGSEIEKDTYLAKWKWRFENWISPFAGSPSRSVRVGSPYFGATRSSGNRRHGATDFWAEKGTDARPIYAVSNGRIPREYCTNGYEVNKHKAFLVDQYWYDTGSVDIIADDGTLIRYCEITPCYDDVNNMKKNFSVVNNIVEDNVNAVIDLNEPIGYTKHNSHPESGQQMLHIVMFSNPNATGAPYSSTYIDTSKYENVISYPEVYNMRYDLLDTTFMRYLPYRPL